MILSWFRGGGNGCAVGYAVAQPGYAEPIIMG